ncbi:MAG: carbohydrate ABC transporter permease, partial [Brachybacterium sp.]|nr:carbohydrate ABC transporter permease [Brachybacterium sp.]
MSSLTLHPDPTSGAPVTSGASGTDGTLGGPRANRGRQRGPRWPRWVTGLLVAGVLATIAVFLVPLFWLFSSSLKPHGEIYSWPLQWIPTSLTLENFTEAW